MLDRVRQSYRGTEEEWKKIERRINGVFRLCGSELRYREEERPFPMADHAVRAAEQCLSEQGVMASELDRVIYGGISREYFEPASAAEIAGKLKAEKAVPFDVVGACAGSLAALYTFAAHHSLDPSVQRGLICTFGITTSHISTNIQTYDEALDLAAGLTVGNAATAMLLSTTPSRSCGRIVAAQMEADSKHWNLCRAPLNGAFIARSTEIFQLSHALTIPHVRKTLALAGWEAAEVDLVVAHQPSNRILKEIALSLGIPLERVPRIHHLFGNTESSSVPMTLRYVLDTTGIPAGSKVLLVTSAGGLLLVSAALIWQ
jgi:3-oxoacyl-[acyl-carrier-protein] synthase-3